MESNSPDYGFWAQHAEVKLYQGIALLCGINPDTADLFFLMTEPKQGEEADSANSPHPPELRRLFRQLFRVATGNLPPAGDLPVGPSYQPGTGDVEQVPVILPKLITWFVLRGFQVSSALQAFAQPIIGPPIGWEGFDEDSPNYPVLLDIALQAWRWASMTAAEGLTPKNAVLAYLAKYHPDLPTTTQNHIATICNWNRTGGRPPGE